MLLPGGHGEGTAQIANLGDSGVVILGSGGVKFKTPQQEHSFGYPFQVGHQEHSDRPEDALQSVVALKAGDVVVVGTDGLFDNLSEEDAVQIAGEVRKQLEESALGRSPGGWPTSSEGGLSRTPWTSGSRRPTPRPRRMPLTWCTQGEEGRHHDHRVSRELSV